jgi:hypothetical protein
MDNQSLFPKNIDNIISFQIPFDIDIDNLMDISPSDDILHFAH